MELVNGLDQAGLAEWGCFVSYATDDVAYARRAKQQIERNGLTVLLDEPQDPLRSPLQVLLRGLRDQVRSCLPWATAAASERLSPEEIETKLGRWLQGSACVLVVWTRSHRGSRWSGLELEIFASRHPARPIFIVRLDDTPWAANTRQWIEVASPAEVTLALIAAHTGNRAAAGTAAAHHPFDVLLRPNAWATAVRHLRAGTSIPELVALRRRAASSRLTRTREEALAVLQSAAHSTMLVVAVVLILGAIAFYTSMLMDAKRMMARHVVYVLATSCTASAVLAVQAPLQAVLPAALAASVLALAAQITLGAHSTDNAGAGLAGGVVLGGLCGSLLVHAVTDWWQRLGTAAPAALLGALKGTSATTAVAGLCIALAAGRQHVRGALLLFLVPMVALLPALGLWSEMAGIVRAREALRGLIAAACILTAAILLASAASTLWPFMDQQHLRGGVVAGTLTGLGAGAAYVAPGALLARQVSDALRTFSSILTLGLTVLFLWLTFEWLHPADAFTADLRSAWPAFLASLAVSAAGGGALRRLQATRSGRVANRRDSRSNCF
jgi:hypothetical protein